MSDYGLPEPDHKFGHAHPTVSGRILDRLAHGAITPKPNIERLEGDTVRFVDGTEVHADLVVYCTGYKITFPFFDEGFVSAADNEVRALPAACSTRRSTSLYFPGLIQPLGAIMPIAERQGELIGDAVDRPLRAAPTAPRWSATSTGTREAMRKRYVASKRHTIQVDFETYMKRAGEGAGGRPRACVGAGRYLTLALYLTKRISEYFGSGQRSSATTFSSRSATSRTFAIAVSWLSRAYSASSRPSTPSG